MPKANVFAKGKMAPGKPLKVRVKNRRTGKSNVKQTRSLNRANRHFDRTMESTPPFVTRINTFFNDHVVNRPSIPSVFGAGHGKRIGVAERAAQKVKKRRRK